MIIPKRSPSPGHVTINVRLRCSGWRGDSATIAGQTTMTASEARGLAASLIALADQDEARVALKAAHEERRRKWREREVAAGRIIGGRS